MRHCLFVSVCTFMLIISLNNLIGRRNYSIEMNEIAFLKLFGWTFGQELLSEYRNLNTDNLIMGLLMLF